MDYNLKTLVYKSSITFTDVRITNVEGCKVFNDKPLIKGSGVYLKV